MGSRSFYISLQEGFAACPLHTPSSSPCFLPPLNHLLFLLSSCSPIICPVRGTREEEDPTPEKVTNPGQPPSFRVLLTPRCTVHQLHIFASQFLLSLSISSQGSLRGVEGGGTFLKRFCSPHISNQKAAGRREVASELRFSRLLPLHHALFLLAWQNTHLWCSPALMHHAGLSCKWKRSRS